MAERSTAAPGGDARPFVSVALLTLGRRALAWLGLAIGASLCLALVELGISLFLQIFLKALGLLGTDVQTVNVFGVAELTPGRLTAILCVLALVRSTTLFLMSQGSNVAMEMITARLRRIAVFETLMHPDKRTVPAASVNARTGDLASKSAQFCASGSVFTSSAVQCLALAGVMFVVAFRESLIALTGLAAVGLLVLRINRATRRVSANVPRELRVLTNGIERTARNMTLIRAVRTERLEHRRLTTAIDAYARHLIRAALLSNFAGALTPFIGILLIIVVVATSQGVLHTPSITLLSFLYLFVRFVQVLSGAVQNFSICNTMWPSFKESIDYVRGFDPEHVRAAMQEDERLVEHATEKPFSSGGEPPVIDIRGVHFRYPGGAEILHDVSTHIEKGSQLAIVGPSGCGKSTLLGLILGLHEPSRGAIRIGDREPRAFFDDPTTRVGYVGAEAFLVAGTIRDNLRYGLSTRATDDDLWRALEAAHLRSTVMGLEGGLEYPIAEDGSGLSAGQKQRLCLARALLSKPHLLLLDEVSANLDDDTEKAVAESLKALRGHCTTILVSHRQGILQYADHVIALQTNDAAA